MTKIKDFTPLVDTLVDELGLVTAAVFGRIWRYANGKEGICFASQKKIGERLSLDRTTVNKHVQILIDKKYIVDLTPDLKRKTHSYQITDKAKIEFTIQASVEETPDSVDESPDSVEENSTSVEESNTNIELNKELNKPLTNTKEVLVVAPELEYVDIGEEFSEKRPKKNHRSLVGMLSRVTGLSSKKHGARLGKSAKKLAADGNTPEEVDRVFGKSGVWYSRDWRGKKGDKPTPELVVEQIDNLLENETIKDYIGGKYSDFIDH